MGLVRMIRSPYLTHGADAEMTLSMQFRLPPGEPCPRTQTTLNLRSRMAMGAPPSTMARDGLVPESGTSLMEIAKF